MFQISPNGVGKVAGIRRRNDIIDDIADALKSSGYSSLDRQAKALGLHRATAWTIIRNKHKLGRLSNKTTTRILENPETPHAVRVVIQQYLAELNPTLSR
jgi:hypothetical protein